MNGQIYYAWLWYLAGAVLTLVWKWQRYCYDKKGTGDPPRKFFDSSREWFELETVGSKISWGVTIGIVWVIGSAFIERVGIGWLFGGVLQDVPVDHAYLMLFGALTEMTVPALAKWIASKIPFASFDDLRK